jgi:hypothetical protein
MTVTNTEAIDGNTPGISADQKFSNASAGSSSGWLPETGRLTSCAVFGPRWLDERHASAALDGQRHASVTLGAKSLGRNQHHAGEHQSVLPGGRDDAGQQPAVFLPDGGLQRLARVGHAGESGTVGRDGGDVGVE